MSNKLIVKDPIPGPKRDWTLSEMIRCMRRHQLGIDIWPCEDGTWCAQMRSLRDEGKVLLVQNETSFLEIWMAALDKYLGKEDENWWRPASDPD